MALHFRTGVQTYNVVEDTVGERLAQATMPPGCYVGFALGADCDYDEIQVEADGVYRVPAGTVVPISRFKGAPRLALSYNMAIADARVHVIGMTCPEELAIRPRRAALRRRYTSYVTAPGPTLSARVPFSGRRHALVSMHTIVDGGAATFEVYGEVHRTVEGDAYGGQQLSIVPSVLLLSGSVGAGAYVGHHIGGSDHEEPWDVLVVTMAGGAAMEAGIYVTAWGEAGG
jgi:hypothetical protein